MFARLEHKREVIGIKDKRKKIDQIKKKKELAHEIEQQKRKLQDTISMNHQNLFS